MRTLDIHRTKYELTDAQATILLESGICYACGDKHDLHISPDGPDNNGWELMDLERLVGVLGIVL